MCQQYISSVGGYRVQGKAKAARSAEQLLDSALAAEEAGAALLLFECVPSKLAEQITKVKKELKRITDF
jgi:3-methyl-2-oxobutanoate hydroxymethyltransferase